MRRDGGHQCGWPEVERTGDGGGRGEVRRWKQQLWRPCVRCNGQ